MDLKEFYFQNVKETEYHYCFRDSIKEVNRTYNIFEGYEEIDDYKFEVLLKLSDMKTKDFYKKFATFFSDDGEKYILDNFSLSYIEYEQNGVRLEKSCKLIMDDILQIIKEMRDMVVHEGNYWELQFFARDSEYQWLTHIQTDEQLLCEDTFKKYKSATYHFETTLQYERFKFCFVEACINYIVDYIKKKTEFNKG